MRRILDGGQNLVGVGVAALIALMAYPGIIRALGHDGFGLLSLCWAAMAFVGSLDVLLSRFMFSGPGTEGGEEAGLQSTRLVVFAFVGLAVSSVFIVLVWGYPPLVKEFSWVERALLCCLISLTNIIWLLAGWVRVGLESERSFLIINVARVVGASVMFMAPVLFFEEKQTVFLCAFFFLAGKLLSSFIVMVGGRHWLKGMLSVKPRFSEALRRVLGAKWVFLALFSSLAISNVEKFGVALFLPLREVGYYSLSSDVVARFLLYPAVVVATITSDLLGGAVGKVRGAVWRGVFAVWLVMAGGSIILAGFASDFLSAWVGDEFSEGVLGVFRIFILSSVFSGLAQIPSAAAQLAGRWKEVARNQLAEFVVYAPTFLLATYFFGLKGGAWACLLRVVVDLFLLVGLVPALKIRFGWVLCLLLIYGAAWVLAFDMRLLGPGSVLLVVVAWLSGIVFVKKQFVTKS